MSPGEPTITWTRSARHNEALGNNDCEIGESGGAFAELPGMLLCLDQKMIENKNISTDSQSEIVST